jgi:hypothetical protein
VAGCLPRLPLEPRPLHAVRGPRRVVGRARDRRLRPAGPGRAGPHLPPTHGRPLAGAIRPGSPEGQRPDLPLPATPWSRTLIQLYKFLMTSRRGCQGGW